MTARRLAGLVLAGVLAAGCTDAAARDGAIEDDPVLVSAATTSPVPTTLPPATTAPPDTAVTTTTVPLPVPARVPADPRAPEPEVIIGRIAIPKLGLDTELRQGITLTTLDKGPGHWPGTALPGELGNVVVAGHRVTHTRPFRHLDKLAPGDEVIFTMTDGRTHTYVMVSSEVVPDTAMWIVGQTRAHTATLFACHPPGSARYRYVVRLTLAGAP